MLRPKLYARLDRLGLGHLADQPVLFTRADGALHASLSCVRVRRAADPERRALVLAPRLTAEPVCECSRRSRALGALSEAVDLVSQYARAPQGPVPSGGSPAELQALARRLEQLETVRSHLQRVSLSDPDVKVVRDQLFAEVVSEVVAHRERLGALGADAVLLREAADLALRSHAGWSPYAALGEVLGRLHAAAAVELWISLVESGRSREQRRRRLSGFFGAALVPSQQDVRSGVLAALEVLNRLEDHLEDLLTDPGPAMLLVAPSYSVQGSDGYRRLLLEAFTVAEVWPLRLLVAPVRVLSRITAMSPSRVPSAPLPVNPAHAETAISLWDPSGDALADPASLVEAATRV